MALPARPLRLALAALALVAAGCDGPVAPERTNPYDPETTGARQVSRPETLEVAAVSPTSATLVWTDPSSFETGFEVLYGTRSRYGAEDVVSVRLPPNTTRFEVEGLLTTVPRVVQVRTLGDGGAASDPSPTVLLAYPEPARTSVIRGAGGVLVPEDETVYRNPRPAEAPQIYVYELAFNEGGVETARGQVAGYDRVVGRASAVEVAVERVDEGAAERPYAVVQRTAVRASGTAVSPGGAFEGPSVVAADGSAMAAVYRGADGARRLLVWDPRTGAVLDDGAGGAALPDGRPSMITRAGTVVFAPTASRVVGWDPTAGAETWRLDGVPGRGPVVDPGGDRLAIWLDAGGVEVIDADTGGLRARIPTDPPNSRAGLVGLVGRFVVLFATTDLGGGAPEDVVVWDLEAGAVARAFGDAVGTTDLALDGDALVTFGGTATVGEAFRIPLFADWARDLANERDVQTFCLSC